MRELKFRAWDGKRYVYFSNMTIGLQKSKKVIPYVYFETDTFNGEVRLGSYKIEQYTGLKDDNGRYIYEGDIVYFATCKPLSVEWNDDTCEYQFSDGSPINNHETYGRTKLVIGNIHENPELLK